MCYSSTFVNSSSTGRATPAIAPDFVRGGGRLRSLLPPAPVAGAPKPPPDFVLGGGLLLSGFWMAFPPPVNAAIPPPPPPPTSDDLVREGALLSKAAVLDLALAGAVRRAD